MKKNILVVHSDALSNYPPVISLCSNLLEIGCSVTLLTKGVGPLPETLRNSDCFQIVDFGTRPHGYARIVFDLKTDSKIRHYCKSHISEFDAVWTTTDFAARACGKVLLGRRHIMQLMELVETVPAFTYRDIPFKSHTIEILARKAFHVVVPEYNRAFIQQAWWQIDKTPIVLPNKSLVTPNDSSLKEYSEIDSLFRSESRKIILYQGYFGPDRDFKACMDAMDLLGGEYALYLMGARSDQIARLKEESKGRETIRIIPYIPAPNHLLFTHYGHIGLLPYQPTYSRESPLNALYCAPNKIWEYSRFGLPMIGSQMPALKTIFDATGIGLTVDFHDPGAIAEAVRDIELNWNDMSIKSCAYYDSVDTVAIVERTLTDPDASL